MPKDLSGGTFYKVASLEYAPEIAQALGNVMAAWSQAESVLHGLLTSILKIEYTAAGIVFYSIPTFDGRVRLIKNYIRCGKDVPTTLESVLKEIEGLRGLSGTRNSFVHGSWATDADGIETCMFNYLEPANALGRRKRVRASDLTGHAKAVTDRSASLVLAVLRVFPRAPVEQPVPIPIPAHRRT